MPRLNVEITEEQRIGLDKILTHGMRKPIFQTIINDLLALCEKHGSGPVIGALINRSITLKDICKLKEVQDEES